MLGEALYIISTIFLILCCCVVAIWVGLLLEPVLVMFLKK